MHDGETHVLEEASETVYERPDTHGEPEDSFATIARLWHEYLWARADDGGRSVVVEPHDVANMMMLLKIARNAEGHYHADNYVDIAGYAENGARVHEDHE